MNADVLAAIARLYALLALGYTLRRAGRVGESVPEALTVVVTEVTMPALIVATLVSRPLDPAMLGAALAAMAGMLASLGVAWVVGPKVTRDRPALGTFLVCATFCNTGFLGIPVALALWGPGSEGLVSAVMVDSLTTTLLLNTVGVLVAIRFGGEGRFDRAAVGRLLRAPMFLAVPVGLVLQPLAVLPAPVTDTLGAVGGATSILVFLATGMRLRFGTLRRDAAAVAAVAGIRFVVSPLVALLVALALGLRGEAGREAVLEVAMPTALMAPVVASRYGCDPLLGPVTVAVTTALAPLAVVGTLAVCALAGM